MSEKIKEKLKRVLLIVLMIGAVLLTWPIAYEIFQDGLFLALYLAILVVSIVLIVKASREEMKWRWPILIELISTIGTCLYMCYLDKKPYIPFDGFAEALYSFIALIVDCILLFITLSLALGARDK